MKATAAISIAALVAALAATPSMALDLNLGVGANAGVDVSSDEGDSNAGVGLGVDLNADAHNDDGDGLDVDAGLDAGANATVDSDDDDGGSVSAGGSVDAGATVDSGDAGVGVDTSATGAINAQTSDDDLDVNARLDALIELINDSDYSDTSFDAWADASNTTVINVDDLFDLEGNARIDAAIQANLGEHDDLNAAIDANAGLKAWLDSNGIDASSVIAIDVSADGSVDVYEG